MSSRDRSPGGDEPIDEPALDEEIFEGLEPIAIVGMAGRFPGAADVEALWQLLWQGREGLRPLHDEELAAAGVSPERRKAPGFVAAGGPLDDIERFDADFFAVNPREAQLMDPQHRLFLETCWQVLEDAGQDPRRLEEDGGSVGVFAGCGESSYLLNQLLPQAERLERLGGAAALFASGRDFLTTRVSYKLGLTGPSLDVQTACSTSLVAVHLACQALLAYQCDLALAGGVSIKVPQGAGYFHQQGGIRSPDGRCRPFDASASGTVDGSGLAVVALARLEDALASGDPIRAVIRATAINNDGARKIGYTAPGVEGQASVIATALELAGIEAGSIGAVEAHGTGTALGDPIEVRALHRAYGAGRGPGTCALGSVKGNLGHLDAAAGATGLIKAALCLERRGLPPSLHFERPNPEIDFAAGPFYVPTERREWLADGEPRRAAVSSFGIGGTNAHAVLEEAPPRPPSGPSRPWQLVLLSARDPAALEAATSRLGERLAHPPAGVDPDAWLADAAHTLRLGRRAFPHRLVAVGRDLAEVRRALTGEDPGRRLQRHTGGAERRVAFLFPGQGAQRAGVGAGLYTHEPAFRDLVDRGAERLLPELGLDLRDLLLTPGEAQEEQLRSTRLAQPALFLLGYALARLWQSWGVEPAALLGHSLGEYVAACLAEVFSFEDALALVASRGRRMQKLPPGAMLALPLPAEEIVDRLGGELSLAAHNAPRQCVVSGPEPGIDALAAELGERGIRSRHLATSHAFHSAMMDPILDAFTGDVARCGPRPPRRRFVSSLTGTWITEAEATDPRYWARQLRQPVDFVGALATLAAEGDLVLLETGPGDSLTKLARRAVPELPAVVSLPMAERDEQAALLTALGRLWLQGAEPDWRAFAGDERRYRVPLPTYPFQRRRFWIDRPPEVAGTPPEVAGTSSEAAGTFPEVGGTSPEVGGISLGTSSEVGGTSSEAAGTSPEVAGTSPEAAGTFPEVGGTPGFVRDVATFLHRERWAPAPPRAAAEPGGPWLLLLDEGGVGQALAAALRQRGETVETLGSAPPAADEGEGGFRHFLAGRAELPRRLVVLWLLDGADLDRSFLRLLGLARALHGADPDHRAELLVVSCGRHAVTETEVPSPEQALALGPCRVIPLEMPGLVCRSIDLDPGDREAHPRWLLAELGAGHDPATDPTTFAWRGGQRLALGWEPFPVADDPDPGPPRGGWLLTGGLGGLGLEIAHHLAAAGAGPLTLLTRSPLPPRRRWPELLAAEDTPASLARKLRRLRDLERSGVQVVIETADISDRQAMAAVIGRAREAGELRGVVHAAGIAGGGLIALRRPEQIAAVLAPKVEGTRVLDQLLRDVPLDTFLVCSSLGGVLGNTGQVDYCAANCFQDAWAAGAAGRRPWRRVVAVAWDAWREVGMAVETPRAAGVRELHDASLAAGLSTAEGLAIFDLARRPGPASLVVSTRDLDAEITRRRAAVASPAPPPERKAEPGSAAIELHPRPELDTPYQAPVGELESALAELWQELLGIAPIGRHDDFAELGGHSLLATEIMARIRRRFGVHLPLGALLSGPTVALLARAVAEAGGGLEGGDRTQADSDDEPLPLVPDPDRRHEPFPLTAVQEAYWVGRGGGFELGNVSMHGYIEAEVRGLDLDRYSAAWRRLIERHEMLRAVVDRDGRQRILPRVPPFELAVDDLRGRPTAEVEAELLARRREMSHQVLPTDRWPLFDLRASRLEDDLVRLHLSFDGIMMDGWSWQVLARDLDRLYREPDAALPRLELSFRDYVLALEALRRTPRYERCRDYWRSRIPQLPPAPSLPLAGDPKRLGKPTFTRRGFELAPELWRRIKERGASFGLTPSCLVAAAFGEALGRWSESPHFTLDLTLFNRRPLHPQVGEILGDFTSLTLLAVEPPAAGDFAARARALQERLWQDLDHRDFDGMEVLRELARRRGSGTRAVMPVVLTSLLPIGRAPRAVADEAARGEEAGPGPASRDDTEGRLVYSISQTPQVWIDHQVRELAGRGVFTCDAVEELFPHGLLDDLLGAYERLLRDLAEEATWRRRAPLRLPAHQRGYHAGLRGAAVPVEARRLEEGFFASAAARPDAPAVIAAERTLTFGRLARGAEALAAELRRRGVGRGELVAVVMPKDWRQALAVLAVLRAGAAYLPLDAALPGRRLRRLLERAEARFAVTAGPGPDALAELDSLTTVDADERWLEGPEVEPVAPQHGPADLAYVIFTSGSTGEPKGVTLTHGQALTTLEDVERRLGLGPDDRTLAISSLSFDLSVFDLFGIWRAGGAAVLPVLGGPGASPRDPALWLQTVERSQVTVWSSVPALFEMLVEHLEIRRLPLPPSLRVVMLSGDWIPVSLPGRARQRVAADADEPRLLSLGGATEGAVWSIVHEIGEVDESRPSIPYGRALDNQSFLVLGPGLEPCPAWVPGDLYIGGAGIALGYWGEGDRTAASFVPHPGGEPGERLYRTGDRGCLRPDGEIEFLGRDDFQVQVQGYRVEPGEIEKALLEHPAVTAAAVTAVRAGGDRRTAIGLVAHVAAGVAHGGDAAVGTEELRRHLASRLPDYMVPSRYRILPALPLTGNGKIDRGALADEPEPEGGAPAEEQPATAPRAGDAPTLDRVLGLVARVLERDPPPADVPFLDLGASSIEMVRLANALEDTFGHRPSLDELFDLGTARAVAGFYSRPPEGEPSPRADEPARRPVHVLRDPEEREAFKRGRPGLRRRPGCAPAVDLGAVEVEESEPWLRRRSVRRFAPELIRRESLAGWLRQLARRSLAEPSPGAAASGHLPKARYGSAGGLYPVQVYLVVKPHRIGGVGGGSYYYHPEQNRLVPLALGPDARLGREVHDVWNRPIFDEAAFSVFLVGRLAATAPIYGEHAADFCRLEAGLITQLLETEAPVYGLGLCQIGRVDAETVFSLLDLPADEDHLLAHSLLGGLAEPEEAEDPEDERTPDGSFPLTDMQEAYWLGQQTGFELGGVVAHVYEELELETFDPARFDHAWSRLVARHETLRTVLTPEGRQRVLPEVPAVVSPRLDLRALDLDAARRALDTVARTMCENGPDPGRWPLFEIRVSRLPGGRTRLHLSLCLMICDALSVAHLWRDLARLYADPELRPEPPAYSFRAYVRDLRRARREPAYRRALDYWRGRLDTLPPPPDLPLARDPAARPGAALERHHRHLEPALWSRLTARARAADLTPTTLLAAVYAQVLAACCRSHRFTLNLLFFDRRPFHPEVGEVVGNFSSPVLLEVDADPERPFVERARALKSQLLQDLEHSAVTGVEVLRELNRVRGGDRRPLPVVFVSSLDLVSWAPTAADPGARAVTGRRIRSALQTPYVWLDLQVFAERGGLGIHWDVAPGLFPEGLPEAMADTFAELLGHLAADDAWAPGSRLATPRLRELLPSLGGRHFPSPASHAPASASPPESTRPEAPDDDLEDDLERILLETWQELLGRPVGRHDNFFELGGHSLLAVRLVGRLEQTLGRPVPLAALLTGEGTVADLASRLREGVS